MWSRSSPACPRKRSSILGWSESRGGTCRCLTTGCRGEKVPSRVEVIVGNRARAVVNRAAEMGADLIVLTAPRIDPDKVSAGLGSLSYMVGIFAPCPVLLVK